MKNYCESTRVVIQLLQYQNKVIVIVHQLGGNGGGGGAMVVVMVILTYHSVVPIEHSRMGLAKGRPGSLSQ